MRILVIGGLGVIGRSLAEELSLLPEHELVIADAAPGAAHLVDVRAIDGLRALMNEVAPDVVVNMAALVSFPVIREDLRRAAEINLVGSLNVLEAAREAGVGRVVFGSSKAVYGHIDGVHGHPAYLPVPETHPLVPRNPYDAFKVAAEITGHEFAALHGLDFVALRFGTIYGPGKNARHGYSAVFSRFVEAAVRGEPLHLAGGGDQGDDLMYVRDCARAVLSAVAAPAGVSGSYNIATGRRSTVADFVAALRRAVPEADVSVGPGLNYASETVSYRSVLDVSRAREVLGYAPCYDLSTGIGDYVSWERERSSSAR